MKNQADIYSDGINLYITSVIKADKTEKVILTALNIIVTILYFWLLSYIKKEEIGKFIIPMILTFVLFIFFPWRYWFWNFYGKEHIVINTKTITRKYDYGLIQTSIKTIPHYELTTSYEFLREFDNVEYGCIHFYSHSEETHLAHFIFKTAILLPKTDIDKIHENLQKLFDNEFDNLFAFSEN